MWPVCYGAEPAIPMTRSSKQGLSLTHSLLLTDLEGLAEALPILAQTTITDLCRNQAEGVEGPGIHILQPQLQARIRSGATSSILGNLPIEVLIDIWNNDESHHCGTCA
jgi:hypothetical protein